MTFSAKCWKPRLAALAIAASLLTGCGTGGSEYGVAAACPPVVEYTADLQVGASAEVERLPADSAIADMLSDYAVLRDQVRACRAR
jgi:hypothetical protein